MSNQPCKFTVAICGGGVGGLTLAVALARYADIQVDVYEATAKFTEIGAGVGLWWRTRTILKALGLEEDVLQLIPGERPTDARVPTLHYRKGDQPEGVSFATIESRGGLLGVHRAEFHEVILRRLPPQCRTFTSKRLSHYVQSPNSPVQLVFEDGSTSTCDILIGADGLKSVVRSTMMRELAQTAEMNHQLAEAAAIRDCVRPRWCGVIVYRTLIPSERLLRLSPNHRVFKGPIQYLGHNRHIMAYPVSKGRFVNFAAFDVDPSQEETFYTDPWVSDADQQEIVRIFSGWELEVRQMVQCLEGLKVNRWVVNVVPPLPSYVSGNAALLGDAAHAMTPFQGAGAGQAIEDAYILAALLGHRLTTRQTAAQALQVYHRIREPLVARVADLSRSNGLHFALHGLGTDSSLPRLRHIGQQLQSNFNWVSETDPTADLARAMESLEATLGRVVRA
ncbi:salicylate hydroxylase [Artomyces pyxidatus]|uniref:Salicylate hydroxylase n=1 Tax=Artomyces pyxidatus TaxID=48021 RepID=A0ACB8SMD2_9AGAM|nr:salicylate hydroxylase [Artomyces pyxidatus]